MNANDCPSITSVPGSRKNGAFCLIFANFATNYLLGFGKINQMVMTFKKQSTKIILIIR